jgi:hypothetical protein
MKWGMTVMRKNYRRISSIYKEYTAFFLLVTGALIGVQDVAYSCGNQTNSHDLESSNDSALLECGPSQVDGRFRNPGYYGIYRSTNRPLSYIPLSCPAGYELYNGWCYLQTSFSKFFTFPEASGRIQSPQTLFPVAEHLGRTMYSPSGSDETVETPSSQSESSVSKRSIVLTDEESIIKENTKNGVKVTRPYTSGDGKTTYHTTEYTFEGIKSDGYVAVRALPGKLEAMKAAAQREGFKVRVVMGDTVIYEFDSGTTLKKVQRLFQNDNVRDLFQEILYPG